MRSILLILCGGLVAAGIVLAARGTMPVGLAAAPAPATTGDKAVLGKAIRDYLMANPEVLVEAMQELERKQDSQRDTVAQKAIQENRAGLMSDPESPIVGNPNVMLTCVPIGRRPTSMNVPPSEMLRSWQTCWRTRSPSTRTSAEISTG